MSDYPGSEADLHLLNRLSEIMGPDDEIIVKMKEQHQQRQECWDKGQRPLPDPNSIYGRIFSVVWNDLHGNATVIDRVDTMESAMMKNRVFSVVDAVWNVIKGELK